MIQLTKLENDLLTEIMENELDGVGMGYSELAEQMEDSIENFLNELF